MNERSPGGGTLAAPDAPTPWRWFSGRLVLLAGVGALTFGTFLFAHRYLDGVARGKPGPAAPVLIEELTAAAGTVPLFLLFVWAVPRRPITRETWRRRLPAYVVVAAGLSLLHTLWMLASRSALFPLFGLHPYDYGLLGPRMLMELPNQLIGQGTMIGFLHFAHYYRTTRDRELGAALLQTRLAQAELAGLQSQLHPHFLFNTLNAISALMYDAPAAADRMMTGLAELLRQTLSRRAAEVPLRDELAWLRGYVEIMLIRFRDRLTVRYDVPADTEGLLVPTLVLQPLVENCLKHSLAARPGPTTITVAARRSPNQLRLAVEDDGPGLPDGHRRGVGIENTMERLRHLYGSSASLLVRNGRAGGCVATILMPARDAS